MPLEGPADTAKTQCQWKNLVIPYTANVSEKLKWILGKHNIPVFFKPTNTLRWSFVHPKDQTPKHKKSKVVYAIQFSEEYTELEKPSKFTQEGGPVQNHRTRISSIPSFIIF